MTHIVVYNTCFGGYSLSEKARKWLVANNIEEPYYSQLPKSPYVDIPRHHPLLVECVKYLGIEASGKHASLAIMELEGNEYQIEEYDGSETVIQPSDERLWITI